MEKRHTKKKRRRKKVVKRVPMNMPPPFAHASVKVAKPEVKIPWWKGDNVVVTQSVRMPKNVLEPIAPPQETQEEFDVAVYDGQSIDELKDYLDSGNVDYSGWDRSVLKDLQGQIDNGKCELGLDDEGNCLRVASIAKVFLYDQNKDLLLYNIVNSYENHKFVEAIRKSMKSSMGPLQNVVSESLGLKGKQSYGAPNRRMYGESRKKSENVEIPSSFIFETTFSPFRETPRDAAARVLAWRFGLTDVTGKIFFKKYPMQVRNYESAHFPGLKSEYHVHHVKVNPQFIVPLQKAIPADTVTAFCLNSATNTGINTHWYCWLRAGSTPAEMVDHLGSLYDTNPKVKGLIGTADFSSDAVQAVGRVMKDEAEQLNVWR